MLDGTLTPPMIHLVNPLWDATGGAEARTIETWRILRRFAPTRLWSEYEPAGEYDRDFPVERIRPWRLAFPRGGTLVFIGVYFRVGQWIRLAHPNRIVLVYNTHQPDRLRKTIARVRAAGRWPEIVYTSASLRDMHGGHGLVLESPIDLARFPRIKRNAERAFTIGRLSRDTPEKHHREDMAVYRELAAEGVRIRIMGGTKLSRELAGVPNIELLPAGAEDPAAFLASLDCFFYRTAPHWYEGFGRVVFEAMATGLPVVCENRGGFASYLTHGRDVLLFERSADALAHVRRLRTNPLLRSAMGEAGRATAEYVIGERLVQRTRDCLLPLRSPDVVARAA